MILYRTVCSLFFMGWKNQSLISWSSSPQIFWFWILLKLWKQKKYGRQFVVKNGDLFFVILFYFSIFVDMKQWNFSDVSHVVADVEILEKNKKNSFGFLPAVCCLSSLSLSFFSKILPHFRILSAVCLQFSDQHCFT